MRILISALGLLMTTCLYAQKEKAVDAKASYVLKQWIQANEEADSIEISVSVKELGNVPKAFRIISVYPGFRSLVGKIALKDLTAFASNETVLFMSNAVAPKEELTTGASDPTLNRINLVQNKYPALNGDSIHVSLKERLFDTTDIDLKGRVFKTGLEAATVTPHASLMATIIAGASNSSPFARGAAKAAVVGSSNFANLFPDADAVFQQNKIAVQNHSYGTVVENFYGNEAAAYDAQLYNNSTLVHVFSAGNSGTTTSTAGPYANVPSMANLTGNFKQSKNSISVAAVDSLGLELALSSRGPAFDGRVKPEVVAYGEDGSSGAAALVSGAVVLVQDAYKRAHNNLLPSSSLVKAVLLNSADDAGEKNVDYVTGFGSLNAFAAVKTVNENRIIEAAVIQNEVKSFTVVVPPNTARLKLVLAWTDPAALPNASKALINDLDLLVKLPSASQSWLPWVLNPKANKDSLLLPAQRKVDTLNNAEQVSIDNPAAGTYTIEVKGTRVLSSQSFSVAYQVDSLNTFYWTYPTSTDPLVAKNTHTLRWETNLSGPGQVVYSNNGATWQSIATVPDVSKKYFKWQLPDTTTTALLRMTVGSAVFLSDTFTINPQPDLGVGFNCADTFLLYWNGLPVSQYRLYELGENYLQAFTTTSDNKVFISKAQHSSLYYSVVPLINGKEGLKSNTLNYSTQGTGCYLRSFFLQTQTAGTAIFFAELGSLYNVAEVSFEKLSGGNFISLQTINNPVMTSFTFSDLSLHPGENLYRLRIRLVNGLVIYSSVETVYQADQTHPVVMYPNPAAQHATIRIITNEAGRYGLSIFDVQGRLLYQQELNSSYSEIRPGIFAKGLYFARS
jgi:hypothetical protein